MGTTRIVRETQDLPCKMSQAEMAAESQKLVQDEQELDKQSAAKKEEVAKRAAAAAGGLEYSEPSGPSGLEGWQLSVPNWAEGVGGKVSAWQRPKKTELCREWLQARAQRGGAPAGAPRCWGCPMAAMPTSSPRSLPTRPCRPARPRRTCCSF